MTDIKERLIDSNPWWKGNFELEFKDRDVYSRLQKFFRTPQMLALTGLRRVGKTTLMKKLALDFIHDGNGNKGGMDPKNVVYFSFDDSQAIGPRDVITEYERLTGKDVKTGRHLILFDEVQKLTNWEEKIKIIYDVFGKNAKIIVSGSESLFIRKKSRESLAGRIFEFKVEPLTFREFLAFKGDSCHVNGAAIYEKELLKLFNEFVRTAGFPELMGVKEKDVTRKYLKDGIVDKIIYKDIPKLFNVKDPSILESLLNVFMEEPGQIVELSALASELNISRQTVSIYLTYLEQSFLVRKLYNFSTNRRKIERKLKKYYPAVPSVDLAFREDDYSKSRVFECFLINQMGAEFFWRDAYKNEVDAVKITAEGAILPFEIKYGNVKTEGLYAFMKQFKAKTGFILSYDREDTIKAAGKGEIRVVPAYKFLLEQRPG